MKKSLSKIVLMGLIIFQPINSYLGRNFAESIGVLYGAAWGGIICAVTDNFRSPSNIHLNRACKVIAAAPAALFIVSGLINDINYNRSIYSARKLSTPQR